MSNLKPLHTKKIWSLKEVYPPFVLGVSCIRASGWRTEGTFPQIIWLQGTVNFKNKCQ